MSTVPLHVVYCESELNGVGLVQYVRAESPEAALSGARSPGVRPVKAERFDEAGEWMLDAINRVQRGVAAVHDGLRGTRQSPMIRAPYKTIILSVMAALLAWSVLWWAILWIVFAGQGHFR